MWPHGHHFLRHTRNDLIKLRLTTQRQTHVTAAAHVTHTRVMSRNRLAGRWKFRAKCTTQLQPHNSGIPWAYSHILTLRPNPCLVYCQLQTSSLCTNSMSAHLCAHTLVCTVPPVTRGTAEKWVGHSKDIFPGALHRNFCPNFQFASHTPA